MKSCRLQNNFFYSHPFTQYSTSRSLARLGDLQSQRQARSLHRLDPRLDTGFSQFNSQGNNFLGGFAYQAL